MLRTLGWMSLGLVMGACGTPSAAPEPPAASASASAVSSAATPSSPAQPPSRVAVPPGASDLRSFVGTRTRVLWVQGDGTDPTASGTALVLMGLDTEDGRGERVILGERGSYIKPLFLSRGDRIVFTSHGQAAHDGHTSIVNFDGSDRRRLTSGAALAVWADAQGRDWVYVGERNSAQNPGDFRLVSRFPVDRPEAREVVWDKTPVSGDTFQVSADGKTAGGLFPWPMAGVATLPNGELKTLGDGCWTAYRDAGIGLFWYFDGSHRNVTLVDHASGRRWMVPLNKAPGFENPEVYHPRWTNHPRFVAISGPYNQGGANQVRTGGAQSEIHIGRFSRDYSQIEAWARVTSNGGGDSYPDVWIERTGNPHPVEIAAAGPAPGAKPAAGATVPTDRIVVEGRLTKATAIPTPRSIAPYRHALVVNTYDVVRTIEGASQATRVRVAQWAIRDARVLDEARQRSAGSVAQLTLERYEAHPELEGERLIESGDDSNLPLFYDVGSRP
jgi:hypothetical protein